MKNNLDIRYKLDRAGFKMWELATALGTSDSALSRTLRQELSDVQKEKIVKTIDEMSERRKKENG